MSNTVFIIPIDLGSYEDVGQSITLDVRKSLYYKVETLRNNESGDEGIAEHNRQVVSGLESIIVNGYLSRAILLLKFLENGKKEGKELQPNDWIRYLYSERSKKATEIFNSLNECGNFQSGNLEFLEYVMEELKLITDKQFVFTLDELDFILNMGTKTNSIPRENSSSKHPASVANLLFRILERLNNQGFTSLVSGTKLSFGILEEISSMTYKDKVEMINYYGPSDSEQMFQFAKRFISTNDPEERLLNAICTILEGSRRPFLNFMTAMIENAFTMDKNSKEWKKNLMIHSMDSVLYLSQVSNDVRNFLHSQDINLEKIKREVLIHLVCKTRITKTEFQEITEKYRELEYENLWTQLSFDLIYQRLAFGSSNGETFYLKETFLAIQMSKLISINDYANYLNRWLLQLLSKSERDSNEIDLAFEMLGSLILMKISQECGDDRITSHVLFSKYSKTFLRNYKFAPIKGLVHNENYWKVLLMLSNYRAALNSELESVCAFSLDKDFHINVMSTMKRLSNNERLFITLSSKLNNNSDDRFKENIKATNILNGFFNTNGEITSKKEREHLMNSLAVNKNGKYLPSLRIVFDYYATENQVGKVFKSHVDQEDYSMKRTRDVIVCWSGNEETFNRWFRKEFTEISQTLELNTNCKL